jgi:pilus assembly protein CpaE
MSVSGNSSRGGEQAAEFVAFVSDTESYEAIQNLVLELMLPHTLIRRGSVEEAITYLKEAPRAPQQLVVDISGLSMPLSDMNSLADVCEPSMNVVVIGDRNDIGLFRDLIRLGVTDYIAKPVTPTLLQRVLSFQGHSPEPVRQSRAGKVISVVGARGGVGATTVAANLGWLLANRIARRVVLVDLDVRSGALNMMLNMQSNQGLLEALQNAHRIDPVFLDHTLASHGPRLFTLTSEIGLQDDAVVSPEAVEQLVAVLQHHFHYIIFDIPLHAGPLLWQLLDKADLSLLVADPTALSIRNLLRIGKLTGTQSATQRNMLLLNHIRPEASGVVTADTFEKAVGRRIDFVIPYGGSKTAMAENLGETFAHQSVEFTQAMTDIAHDLSGLSPLQRSSDWKDIMRKGMRIVREKALR